jgi:hypothetical protein
MGAAPWATCREVGYALAQWVTRAFRLSGSSLGAMSRRLDLVRVVPSCTRSLLHGGVVLHA